MKTRSQRILTIMHVIAWIIFVGICIQTGSVATSWIVSLFNPEGAKNLYNKELNFFELRQYDTGYYSTLMAFIVTLSALKAYIAYLGIRICMKLNFAQPFSIAVAQAIEKISYVGFCAGLMALAADAYSQWLGDKGLKVVYSWGAEEFLLLAGVIFIVAQVFKRGIEIQAENELTV